MKKLLFALLVSFNFVSAQTPITFTTSDMPPVGWSEQFAKDTPVTSVNYGNAGANQFYNFSTLTTTNTSTAVYSTPNSTQQSKFPGVTEMVSADNINYFAAKNTANKYIAIGEQTTLGGHVVYTPFSPTNDVYQFTTQYQGNFSGSWGFVQTVPGSWVGQAIADSVMLTYTDTYYDTIDGWGKVKTPIGTYNCLRQARRDVAHTNIQAYYFFSWHQVTDIYSNAVTYQYLAKETKGPVVKFDYDSGANASHVKDVQYSLIPAYPVAHFNYADAGSGTINYTDSSINTPTAYSWTFGDGGTANTANPSHTYGANGTYYVCETVTNASGSDTYCDSVHVTGVPAGNHAPVAVTDTFNVLEASNNTRHVATNDYDPDNNQICVTGVWGSPYVSIGSGGSCDLVQYQPDTLFTGIDTAYYTLCDNGTPVLCDTGMIIYNVTIDPALYPHAVNDASSVTQPDGGTVHAGSNDVSGTGNTMCITSLYGGTPQAGYFTIDGSNCLNINYTPDSTFTGNDTVYYVVCDNAFPNNFCDTAMVVVTSNANAALLPTAAFTYNLIQCGGALYINNSQNYNSDSWHFTTLNRSPNVDSTFVGDTVGFVGSPNPNSTDGLEVEACLTVINQYGNSTICDTLYYGCEGINEVALSSIRIYPNPASNVVTVDMRNNNDDITRNYSAIEIYNVLGEKVKAITNTTQSRVVNINIAGLPKGAFVAAIVSANGEKEPLEGL